MPLTNLYELNSRTPTKLDMAEVYAFYMYLFIIILEIAPTEQTLDFSRSGEAPGVSNFRTVYNVPLQDCRKECMARPSCASINYFRSSQKCELNKMVAGEWKLKEKARSIYSEKADWTDTHLGQCSCDKGEKCEVSIDGHICVIEECDRLATQAVSGMNTVGANADINVQCLEDTHGLDTFGAGDRPDTTQATLTCSSDGTWKMKTPSGGGCLAVVFVMAPGTKQDLYEEWLNGTRSSSDVTWNQYYRNGAIDVWSILTIRHIRLSIFKNLREVKHVVFNGSGSTSLDWLEQPRVIESSWKDISSASYNYFSTNGRVDPWVIRRFFMNRYFDRCPGDVGWFTVTVRGSCDWELVSVDEYPIFVYSMSDMASLMQTNSEKADFVYVLLNIDTY